MDRIRDLLSDIFYWLRERLEGLLEFTREYWKQIILYSGIALIAANILLLGGVFVYYLFQRSTLIASLAEQKKALYGRGKLAPKNPIRIYSFNNRLIGEYLPERGSQLTMKRCEKMKWLRQSSVSSEDRDFNNHGGVSYRGIARAFVNNIVSFSVREGGGTITQQLGRNLFTDRSSPALPRKIYETYAAWLIESKLNKKEILCMYLNKIYMGEGRIGAEEASRFYFDKAPEKLTAAEAAMIVGLYPAPVAYSPLNNIRFSLIKQARVMDALVRDGVIPASQKATLIKKFKRKYGVPTNWNHLHSGQIGIYGASRNFRINLAPSPNEYVRQFLFENFSEEVIRTGGLNVYTTINYARQRWAERSVRAQVERIRKKMLKNKKVAPKKMAALIRRINGVFIAMDPDTGNVRAVVGGFRVTEGRAMTERVWKMKRQVGSVLKGFLYATAIDREILDVNSQVVDEKINFRGYSPRNWYGKYKGPMNLRTAVGLSVNTVAVKALKDIGVGTFRDKLAAALDMDWGTARKRFANNLSIALGSSEMTPMEMARLYAVILNGGYPVESRLILKVTNKDKINIWTIQSTGSSSAPVLSTKATAEAIELMRSIFREEYKGTMKWVGKKQLKNEKYLAFPIAGKTGTVQTVKAIRKKFPGMRGVHDVWFVGLVPGEVSAIWIGHDQGAPFPGSGSGSAGRAWVSYAQNALSGRITAQFPEVAPPPVEVDPNNPDPNNPVTDPNNPNPDPNTTPVTKDPGTNTTPTTDPGKSTPPAKDTVVPKPTPTPPVNN